MFAALVGEYLDTIDRISASIGVRPVILKGAALAFLEYPDPLSRPMTDIDLFLPPDDARRLAQALLSQGMKTETPPPWRATFHYSIKGFIKIDIHFSLHAHAFGNEDGLTFLDPRPYPGYRALMVPSPRAHAAYIVLHAYTHGFGHLRWRSDLCTLLENHPDIADFWDRLPSKVAASGRLHFSLHPGVSGRIWAKVVRAISFWEPGGVSILLHRMIHNF